MPKINDSSDFLKIADAKFKQGEYQEAIDAFRKAIAIKPNWASYSNLASSLFNSKQYKESIEAYLQSLALKENWKTYQGLGKALFKTKQSSKAIEAFKKSLSLKENWTTYIALGLTLLQSERNLEAIDAFNKSLAINESGSTYLSLGWAFVKTNQNKEALEAFLKGLTLEGYSIDKGMDTDEKIEEIPSLLIGASHYNHFDKRVLTRSADLINYRPVKNELTNLIRQTPWETECLYRYATVAKEGIIEIGRFNGGSTLLLSLANPKTKIISIDIAPHDDEGLKEIFTKTNSGGNVDLLIGDASEVYADVIKSGFCYDFLFIDGDHSYEACLKDISTWFPTLSPGGLIAFHDSYFTPGPEGNGVFDAIMEFSKHNAMDFIIPPCTTSRHWENTNGSLCIARKRIG